MPREIPLIKEYACSSPFFASIMVALRGEQGSRELGIREMSALGTFVVGMPLEAHQH